VVSEGARGCDEIALSPEARSDERREKIRLMERVVPLHSKSDVESEPPDVSDPNRGHSSSRPHVAHAQDGLISVMRASFHVAP
jgi:hypothetical protein